MLLYVTGILQYLDIIHAFLNGYIPFLQGLRYDSSFGIMF